MSVKMSKRKMIWVHGTESNQVFRTFVPEEKHSNQLPMMTWADWELLQELHKEQAAKKRRFAALQKGEPLCEDEGCPNHGSPHVCRTVAPAEAVSLENATACIAELQDQIKDWEAKCGALEDKLHHMGNSLLNQSRVIESLHAQNASLSKSLQHYRAAYFADQGKVEVTAEGGPVPPAPRYGA